MNVEGGEKLIFLIKIVHTNGIFTEHNSVVGKMKHMNSYNQIFRFTLCKKHSCRKSDTFNSTQV